MNYWFLALLCIALSLDIVRSSFFFPEGAYPSGYRLKEIMWRCFAVFTGTLLGLAIALINPGRTMMIDFALLMLVGVKMIWQAFTSLPSDASFRFSPGTALLIASSINPFIAAVALGIAGEPFWLTVLFIAVTTFVNQSISQRFAKGKLKENTLFRPLAVGGIMVLFVSILHYIF